MWNYKDRINKAFGESTDIDVPKVGGRLGEDPHFVTVGELKEFINWVCTGHEDSDFVAFDNLTNVSLPLTFHMASRDVTITPSPSFDIPEHGMVLSFEGRRTEGLSFGEAIQAVKAGKKIARNGWNGKNQYVELATRISYVNAKGEIINVEHDAIGNQCLAFVGTSGVQMGWLASQADMLADDWRIVDPYDESQYAIMNGDQ